MTASRKMTASKPLRRIAFATVCPLRSDPLSVARTKAERAARATLDVLARPRVTAARLAAVATDAHLDLAELSTIAHAVAGARARARARRAA